MMVPEGYMTVVQVADKLECSIATVYRLIKLDGLVTHIRRGHERGMLVKESELAEWIKDQMEERSEEQRC